MYSTGVFTIILVGLDLIYLPALAALRLAARNHLRAHRVYIFINQNLAWWAIWRREHEEQEEEEERIQIKAARPNDRLTIQSAIQF